MRAAAVRGTGRQSGAAAAYLCCGAVANLAASPATTNACAVAAVQRPAAAATLAAAGSPILRSGIHVALRSAQGRGGACAKAVCEARSNEGGRIFVRYDVATATIPFDPFGFARSYNPRVVHVRRRSHTIELCSTNLPQVSAFKGLEWIGNRTQVAQVIRKINTRNSPLACRETSSSLARQRSPS